MPIVNAQDFCFTVTILGNKTNTQFVENSYELLTKFYSQHNFTIEVSKMLPKSNVLTQIQPLPVQNSSTFLGWDEQVAGTHPHSGLWVAGWLTQSLLQARSYTFLPAFQIVVYLMKSQGKMEESEVLRDYVLYWHRR